MGSTAEPSGRSVEPANYRQQLALAAICLLGFALRAFRLDWGLPEFVFNDSRIYFVLPAARAVAEGDWLMYRFVQPPVYPYFLSAVTAIWAALSATPVEIAAEPTASMAQIALLQRVINLGLASATIGAVYLFGKRLLGTNAALCAALLFALCPIHVLESHRVNADTPMLLFAVLASHQAAVALQERNRRRLIASFALATLAGASKYSGFFAGTLPLWVTLTWPGASWAERLKLAIRGGLVSIAVMAAAMSPVLFNWSRFVDSLTKLTYISLFVGAPGNDLSGDHWVFARYLYMLFVGLPHLLGWPVLVTAAAGLAVLACQRRPAFAIIAAATVPIALLQGAAEATTTRYFLPLAPYLCICAAAAIAAIPHRGGRVLALAVVGGYTLLLTSSHLLRIEATQPATGQTVRQLARAKQQMTSGPRTIGRKLRIFYPYWEQLKYDPVRPHLLRARATVGYLPPWLRAAPADMPKSRVAEWLAEKEFDAIVVSSRWQELRQRGTIPAIEQYVYDALIDGELGFNLYADHTTSFVTQAWYDWADPTVRTLWTAGIGGYQVFVRPDLAHYADSVAKP